MFWAPCKAPEDNLAARRRDHTLQSLSSSCSQSELSLPEVLDLPLGEGAPGTIKNAPSLIKNAIPSGLKALMYV